MMSGLANALSIAMKYTKKMQMCAVLYRKKTIYSIGISSPITRKQLFTNKLFLPSIHAEVDAITKAFNNYVRIHKQPLHCNIVVTRYCGTSKPCFNCLELMRNPSFHIHIHNVSYFLNGKLKTEKLSDMKTSHVSRGFLEYKAIP